MVRVIAPLVVIIVLAIIGAWLLVYFRRKRAQERAKEMGWAVNGDLSASQERQLIAAVMSADEIFRMLTDPVSNLDEFDRGEATLLSRTHRQHIEVWYREQAAIRKAIGR